MNRSTTALVALIESTVLALAEREAAGTPGCFYFGHLIYGDDSAYPYAIETGLLRGAILHVDRFDNRPRSQ